MMAQYLKTHFMRYTNYVCSKFHAFIKKCTIVLLTPLLVYIQRMKHHNKRLLHWSLVLQEYQLET